MSMESALVLYLVLIWISLAKYEDMKTVTYKTV